MWRETLSMLIFWVCSFLGLAYVILLIIDNNIQMPAIIMIGLFLSAVSALMIMSKLGLSFPEFMSMLKKNDFVMAQEKSSKFLGMTKDGILIKGYFFGRYILVNEDLLSESSTSSNIRFYFPCSTPGVLNHYIVKYGTTYFKAGPNRLWINKPRYLTISEEELYRILFNMCSEIDFLSITRLSSGQGFICIETGPKSLLYGKHAERNIRGILKFIKAYKNYFECQDAKWGANINLDNLNEKIQAIENSCKAV